MTFMDFLTKLDDIAWGIPMLCLIMGGGLLLTIRLKGMQFKRLGLALKYMLKNEEDGEGEVTSFGALCTALSATVGTGNIVGVATAILVGGPGALFWMFVAACIGMATKYAEGLLSIKYRVIDKDGHVLGGPFYYIERGMGKKWTWLAKLFAIFGCLAGLMGIGTITQVNGVASAVETFVDPQEQHIALTIGGMDYTWATVVTAVVVAVAVALVIIGGIKRISKVSETIVPFMIVIYIVITLAILIFNIKELPAAFVSVIKGAFGLDAAAGGVLGAIFIAMQKGVARGVFSNEAGLGSAPIAAAAAKTNEPVRQGLVTMTGTFIDTIIVCMMTGFSILVTGANNVEGLEGAAVTAQAFGAGLPWAQQVGAFFLMLCLALFAFTTILGWDYYAERCLEYLLGGKKNSVVLTMFRWLYILAVLIGPFLTVSAVWTIADIFNGFMAIPNLIALIVLSGIVVKETKAYFDKLGKDRL
ncbi:MAG: alanine/glycine:cation symporter family protein [Anaerovoracaceae bacterium]|nr:alanine/glycine:cation symporter family protein [Anaerovoracaceae bacterium]